MSAPRTHVETDRIVVDDVTGPAPRHLENLAPRASRECARVQAGAYRERSQTVAEVFSEPCDIGAE
jgi:hypothetical protein